MKLLVVGAGEMGRWFGAAVAAELPDAEISFADADPAVAEEAASDALAESADADAAGTESVPTDALAGDAAASPASARAVPLSTDERFDAVCVAVPVSAAREAIAEHAPKAERAVLDVTGRMADPVAAMAEAAPDRERASLHPLFAAANAPGNVAVVADAPGPATDRLLDALRDRGNAVVETTPEEHDRAMTTVQSKAHAAILSFALAADEVPEGLSTPIFEDLAALVERVTGNTPAVYAEIQESFGGADAVAEAARKLAEADAAEFADLYREAGE